ncbi:MAG: bifunctional 23S rRNA (guanine(2069)-N(7))-methyltransferase RlmK/23S rRNA (guanine(2445)-N(2))-methyltransferase RlmL, partial [Ketobacteraceae bacterium]|nr:bifunctional 23S rRNA (guanine(2069)-N(7))-methyltransferase RlmK/23S rRNA (guanine(2445)-N(2))-methyltransferase RlmL [Ketobacteraceae bacterium]
ATFRLKDAIRDYFQKHYQSRPALVKDDAQVVVHGFWQGDSVILSLDLAGRPLHQRGYRKAQGKAPLKETLAAAMLCWSGWPAAEDQALLDPFCGSGTLLIEAALIAKNIAPGLLREFFALTHYRFFDQALWQGIVETARSAPRRTEKLPLIRGYDASAEAINAATENIQVAGLAADIHVERAELGHLNLPKSVREIPQGLLITNAPYGERIATGDAVTYLYMALGRILHDVIPRWRAGVLSNQVEYIDKVGLESDTTHRLFNGPIRCYFRCARWLDKSLVPAPSPLVVTDYEPDENQRAFVNRLRKNLKPLRKWAEREQVRCYRIYDADMPEFNMAIDWYDGELHLQEYKPPKTVEEERARQRLDWAVAALVKLLDVPRSAIVVKTRARQKGRQQYRKLAQERQFRMIQEGNAWLLVNLRDYLDTGLFLDHRPVRNWINSDARGKRFLNLFAYTGAATVQAAAGGAKHTVSVDMSRTYLDWARSNLLLNGFSEDRHRLVQANCLQWLARSQEQFDLIFLDPPTFSNSKRMKGVLDIQRDHVELVELAMKRLERGGKLLFSNNFKKFTLDPAVTRQYVVKDVTTESIPPDFKGSKNIHCCFEIRHR